MMLYTAWGGWHECLLNGGVVAKNSGEQLPNAWGESNGAEVAWGCRVISC